MPSCEVLELIRVSPADVKSRHVIICVHGFLMQEDDVKEDWDEIVKHYKYAEVYALRWTSTTKENFFDKGAFKGLNSIIGKVKRVADF